MYISMYIIFLFCDFTLYFHSFEVMAPTILLRMSSNFWVQIILLLQPPKELREQIPASMPSLRDIFKAKIIFIFDIF